MNLYHLSKYYFSSSELGFIATQRFNQIDIILTKDSIPNKKKKEVQPIIALRSEPLSSSAVVTNTMHPGP